MKTHTDLAKLNFFMAITKRVINDQSVEFLGERKINGLTAVGYRISDSETSGPYIGVTIWADTKTKQPILVEMHEGEVTSIMSNFVFDVELDESQFDLTIPDGYTSLEK
jgi:outer membrane lipoprotein-sorting protein